VRVPRLELCAMADAVGSPTCILVGHLESSGASACAFQREGRRDPGRERSGQIDAPQADRRAAASHARHGKGRRHGRAPAEHRDLYRCGSRWA